MQFLFRVKISRVGIGQISIPELRQVQRLAEFCTQGLVGFMFRDWLCMRSAGQGQGMFLWFKGQGIGSVLKVRIYFFGWPFFFIEYAFLPSCLSISIKFYFLLIVIIVCLSRSSFSFKNLVIDFVCMCIQQMGWPTVFIWRSEDSFQ